MPSMVGWKTDSLEKIPRSVVFINSCGRNNPTKISVKTQWPISLTMREIEERKLGKESQKPTWKLLGAKSPTPISDLVILEMYLCYPFLLRFSHLGHAKASVASWSEFACVPVRYTQLLIFLPRNICKLEMTHSTSSHTFINHKEAGNWKSIFL